ncbi:histidine--tRNA ligase [Lentisphaerota bacterium ZTH]|nr:histidine--tRNA ligase [Lentisphaerota bacterium]WET06851.1 histidine--tRNA ligase [Lentisphaerota bacterium ZTH]
MAKFSPPPGTADIFPEETPWWRRLEDTARKVFPLYGYGELRTPIFEYTEVFTKGIGNETEVVQKEMYTFEDRGGRSLTLRPEGTAGVMRALLNTDVMNGNEKRVFYIGPMFRGERPAAGRRRQFHQIGVENVGRVAPELDAENMAMLIQYLEELDIAGAKLLVNTRGVAADRKPAEEALQKYFKQHVGDMCEDCQERIDRNVWRILDCKQEGCGRIVAEAPDYVSLFTSESRKYFDRVCQILDSFGVDFEVDKQLVRGLDYYAHTVYEVIHPGLGAQNAIAGGGRYELFLPQTKKPVQGVGFAAGMERLLMVQEALQAKAPEAGRGPVFLVSMGDEARMFNMKLANDLRRAGIAVMAEVENKSMKAQMRAANRLNSSFTVICGDDELARGIVVGREMETGEQKEYTPAELMEYLNKSS